MRERTIFTWHQLAIAVFLAVLSQMLCFGQLSQPSQIGCAANTAVTPVQAPWETTGFLTNQPFSTELLFDDEPAIQPFTLPVKPEAAGIETTSSRHDTSEDHFTSHSAEKIAVGDSPVQPHELSKPTPVAQFRTISVPAPPDVQVSGEMAAYYAVFTTYAFPVSLTNLPEPEMKPFVRLAPALLAENRDVHSNSERHSSSLHKLLFAVRMVKIASVDTARFMHRVFVGSTHSQGPQSLASRKTHEAIPGSTRDPCGGHLCSG